MRPGNGGSSVSCRLKLSKQNGDHCLLTPAAFAVLFFNFLTCKIALLGSVGVLGEFNGGARFCRNSFFLFSFNCNTVRDQIPASGHKEALFLTSHGCPFSRPTSTVWLVNLCIFHS